MKTKGLTLLEVMIVVAIIGLVAAIAIPAVTRLAEDVRADICRTNLNTIDKSKMQWAFDNNKSDTDEPTADDLDNYVVGEVPTECVVAGALYDIGSVVTPALCSFHGNGVTEGSGLILPPVLLNEVKSNQLKTSDILDGDWIWGKNLQEGYRVGDVCGWREADMLQIEEPDLTKGRVGRGVVSTAYTPGATPEITINGNTLKGDRIQRNSKEYIEYARSSVTYADYPDDYVLFRDPEGCYEVYNASKSGTPGSYECYDHKGNLLLRNTYDDYGIE